MIKDIEFTCDEFRLIGSLHLPDRNYPPIVIGCHGLVADRSSPKQIALAERCARLGIAYFRFDHRGCGESEGDFEDVTTLNARCRDLQSAWHWAVNDGRFTNRIGLFGSSMGGTVCLASSAELKVSAIVTVAAPVRSRALAEKEADQSSHLPSSRFFTTPERQFDILSRLGGLTHVLMFHGESDEIVPLAHAEEIFTSINPPKQLIVHEKGDHRVSNPADQKKFVKRASAWFQQYLG